MTEKLPARSASRLLRRAMRWALLGLPAAAMAGRPPLPTPCGATNCGTSASSFVTYGQVANGQPSVSGTQMTLTQQTAAAIVNWANFNIANGYTVTVKQPSSTAEILNNIWSADPSVIAGALHANGQVYLYNQNGIVFDKGAQVDVGALTASTLNFAAPLGSTDPDALFKNGILSNNVNATLSGTLPPVFQTPAAASGAAATCSPGPCAVTVNPGATLTASDGGRIMLLGQAVTNQGTISTPDGQAILAAGNTVYLAASTDPSLRGLLIEVNAGGAPATVTNAGVISAPRGNVTLAGLVVNQAGEVSATTSVSANGSIYLVAGDTSAVNSSGNQEGFYDDGAPGFGTLLPNNGGQLTLTPGSVTEVLPDSGAGTVSEQNLVNFIPSQIALVGQSVTLKGNATVRAPGATVLALAAADPNQQFSAPGTAYNDGGRIYLDSGSTIDVSGLTNVAVPVTSEILQVTLEGNDLQNDPLLRNGFLHGTQVTVNVAQGSTLFNVAPYAANIQLDIDQVLTAAGSIELNSNGDVLTRAGSTLNVSGGSIAYQGGYAPATTTLLAATGQVYNIANAPNDIPYVAVANGYSYTDPTWGTKVSGKGDVYYPGYLQGANAGELEVLGQAIYLRGAMQGATVAGLYQRTASTMPQGATFELGCGCVNVGDAPDYRAPAVVFANGLSDTLGTFDYSNLAMTLPAALASTTAISPAQLTEGGFTRLLIYSNGAPNAAPGTPAVVLPAGTNIELPAGGILDVTTDQAIAIDGEVSIAGSYSKSGAAGAGPGLASGSVFTFESLVDQTVTFGAPGLATSAISLLTTKQSPTDPNAHDITLGPGAVLDVTGAWINDSPLLIGNLPGTAPLAIDGGSVSLSAAGDVTLGAGSRIDVSGGGWVSSAGKLTPGAAGSISLSASFQPVDTEPYQGSVSLGAGTTLLGASLESGAGGSLAITSGAVTVADAPVGSPGELLLPPSFFADRGFAAYSITGQNGLIIGNVGSDTAPVLIDPVVETLVFTGNGFLEPTGMPLESFTSLETLPPSFRSPVSLAFKTTASTIATGEPALGNLVLAENASIVAAPGASAGSSVSLSSTSETGSVSILGSIIAPAGTIAVSLGPALTAGTPDAIGFQPNQQLLIGPEAQLEAGAYAQINTENPLGYREGAVLGGGSVSVLAYKGFVVMDPGSLIDVSGTAAVIDVTSSNGVTPTWVAGNAGSIDIEAREGIVLEGTLRGEPAELANGAPMASAAGGTLTVGLDLYDFGATEFVNQTQGAEIYPVTPRTLTLTSAADYVPSNQLLSGTAAIDVASLSAGGFDRIALKSADVIAIQGDVALATRASLVLDAPLLEGNPGSSLTLHSAYVALGNYDNQPDYFDGSNGIPDNPVAQSLLTPLCTGACSATLNVSGQLIDIRGVSGFAGFASETLASSGDLRLTSALNYIDTPPSLETPADDTSVAALRSGLSVSGSLTLEAQQIYPTTNTDFTLTAASAVTVESAPGAASAPLSAGGILTINAPTITQGGVLRAPMGEINLNAVSTTNPVTGVSQGGSVVLSAGSVTSVSADGAIIPYGSTVNGEQWTYTPDSVLTEIIGAPPAKTVNLTGSAVTVSKGATVDVSGGGDLYAYEFIPGEGGSQDVLSPGSAASGAYTYAVLPSLGSSFAPIDAQYQQGSLATGTQTISLSGVPGLANGTYALLPAYYALLPGAFALQITTRDSGIPAGPAVEQGIGTYVAAGRLGVAGTPIEDSLNSTVLIAPGSVVRTQSAYTDSYANAFFSSAAASNQTAIPALPADAGELQIAATAALTLNGSIDFAVGSYQVTTSAGGSKTVDGQRGAVSIDSPNILIVDSTVASNPSGALELSAQSLDALGAGTLVIGGTVASSAAGEQIQAGSTQSIELANTSVALAAPEVVLVAQNSIDLDPQARLSAQGAASATPLAIVLDGAGALLRASSGGLAPLQIGVAGNGSGSLSVGAGASVAAAGSLLLYSAGNTVAQPGASLEAAALGVYSSRVSLGAVPTGAQAPNGLNLTTALLSEFKNLSALTIGSTSTIDFYGGVNLALASSGASPSSLTLDAWAIDGYGSGASALRAGTITLQNSGSVAPSPLYLTTPSGSGSLTLEAEASSSSTSGVLTLGTGDKTLAGFSSVDLIGGRQIQGVGSGSLTLAGTNNAAVPLTLESGELTVATTGSQSISTTGPVSIATSGVGGLPAATVAGALSITGSSIAQNGNIELPAGLVRLEATSGNVTLGAGSVTSAVGADESFSVTEAAVAGGQITLVADQGNVEVGAGAVLDVRGVSTPDGKVSSGAGSLGISAPQGTLTLAGGQLEGSAPAGQAAGSFTLDEAAGLAGSGFASLEAALAQGGFTGPQALRSRTDDAIAVTGRVVASSFELTADEGSITVSGTIDTSGGTAQNPNGGAIAIWAGSDLTLASGAQLLANGGAASVPGVNGSLAPTHGGNVTLGTESGTLALNGATLSLVGSGGAATDGVLTLRAPQTTDASGAADVAITVGASNVANTRVAVIIEGFKTYADVAALGTTDSGCGASAGGACDIADTNGVLFTDAATFVAGAPAIATRLAAGFTNTLGAATPVQLEVRPGIEVDSMGDLTIGAGATVWDLDSWNAALGTPVNVTLRAAGNLIFDASLSDGFTSNGGAVASWTFGESGVSIDSASYRLTAGADLSSANPLAVTAQPIAAGAATPNSGNLILTPGNLIRTGDGSIGIAAGGDVLMGFTASYDASGNLEVAAVSPLNAVIYTAGVPSAVPDASLFVAPTGAGRTRVSAAYPTDGGNLTVSADDDIQSAPSAQLITDWLWRQGAVDPQTGLLISPGKNTSWFVVFADFEQGIGALGGGDVALQAGGNIVNVSAVVPSTGELLGAAATLPLLANLVEQGAGNLAVRAGGNIESGVFEDEWGNAVLSAGGAITANATLGELVPTISQDNLAYSLSTPIYPVLAVGTGTFDVEARTGITLNSIVNGSTLPVTVTNKQLTRAAAYYFTYGASGALDLSSAGGDIVLQNDSAVLPQSFENSTPNLPNLYAEATFGTYYPPVVNVTSFSGNIEIEGTGLNVFPSASGTLNLLAQGSIGGGFSAPNTPASFEVTVFETSPDAWANVLAPQANAQAALATELPLQPLYQQQTQPDFIVANSGNIEEGLFVLPKAADLIAGGNIVDLDFQGKNLNPSDVTLIEAGGTLSYSTPTVPLTNALLPNANGIDLAGPGYLEVLTGGALNLGDSAGLITSGALSDTRLSASGASLVAGAGFGTNASGGLRAPDTAAFIAAYLAAQKGAPSAYASELESYIAQLFPAAPAPGYSAALAAFEALTPAQQLPLIASVLSDILSATGLAHTTQGASYAPGYAAINTLFPSTDAQGHPLTYQGDIDMFYSQLKTEEGGNINLLVPGGSVIVGVPNPSPSLNAIKSQTNPTISAAANLGLLVLGTGAIEGFAYENFEVNQSRILTLEGGDIILWASEGSIDAGNGAKSASGAPPPVIETNSNGTVFVNPINDVSGSGIGQLLTGPNETAGLVNLIAPNGVVNAGDAGIRVAGNLNIAAVQVIGAGNISVVGTATGVPVSEAGAFAGALSGANALGDASKTVTDQLAQDLGSASNYQQLTQELAPTFISVKMFCLGVECETQ